MGTKTIFKYLIEDKGEQSILMPDGAEIAWFGLQWNKPWLWVIVDPEARRVTRKFRLLRTGETMENYRHLSYVGSVVIEGGVPRDRHLFEIL